jgi:hypothetical protein
MRRNLSADSRGRQKSLSGGWLVLASLWLLASACHKWVTVAPPSEVFRQQMESCLQECDQLRVCLEDESLLEGEVVGLTSDTVALLVADSGLVEVAIEEIESVEMREDDVTGSTFAVLGIAAFVVGTAALIIMLTVDWAVP